MRPIRILFLADSHLGFDLPARPRVKRRRRGHDFLANYSAALGPALSGEADVVVHGGDVFHRSKVPASLAWQAFEPLTRIADAGVPVFIVPGNHDRSRLPHRRFGAHPRVHVFDRPRTFRVAVRGATLALAGFPFERRDIRTRFADILERTGWRSAGASVTLLCMHQCVEGATVGPGDFRFTTAADVVRCRDLPPGLAAVLSGHIHRHQVLTRDLRGGLLSSPVLYPGSIERTSFAEMGEPKGFMRLDVSPGDAVRVRWEFRGLPARPMSTLRLDADELGPSGLEAAVRSAVASAASDAILRIRVAGTPGDAARRVLSAAHLRTLAPRTMTVEIRAGDDSLSPRRAPTRPALPRDASAPASPRVAQLDLIGDSGQ